MQTQENIDDGMKPEEARYVGGGAKLVKNGRSEIPARAARKFVSVVRITG